jgi:hypothetical protein
MLQVSLGGGGGEGGDEPDLPNIARADRTTQGLFGSEGSETPAQTEGLQICAPFDSPHACVSVYKSSAAESSRNFMLGEFH